MSAGELTIRPAVEEDTALLVRLVRELAAYEQQASACALTESALRGALFGSRPLMAAIIAEHANEPAGYALFFLYFAPYPGVAAMFLEHIYVMPERRCAGVGRALIREVARTAVEQGAERLEWGVLKWNEPAIEFYTRLGAQFVDDFMGGRLAGDTLRQLAAESPVR